MSDGAFNLGSQHPVRIDATDDAPMTLINKGDTIYAADLVRTNGHFTAQ